MSVIDPAGVKSEYLDYTASGNPQTVKVYDNLGAVRQSTSLGYDLLGRLTSTSLTVASGTYVTGFGYDQLGNRTSVTDAENRQTLYAVNFKGQVTKVTDALAKETDLDYTGGAGKVTSVIDANLNETTYAYYPTGKLKSETDPRGKRLLYSYYPSGKVEKKLRDSNNNGEVDAGDQVLLSYTYYPNGQLQSTTDNVVVPAQTTSYTYWPTGKLKTASNPNIAYSFEWYANGWPKSVTDTTNNRVITYNQYDGIGQKKQTTLLGETVYYDYDSKGRLWKIRSAADFYGKPFVFGYDELSRRKTLTYPSGAVTTSGYHPETGWLSSLVTKNSTGVELINLGYGVHDKVGNRKARSEGGMTTSYDYDAVHQLTRAATGESAENFDYDPVGNRKSGPTVKETVAAAYDHAIDNGMTLGRKFTYTYDDYGNRQYGYFDAAHSKYWQYTWDGENRLTKVELKKNSTTLRTVSFKYDPFGRRIEKKVEVPGSSTVTHAFVYDAEDIVFEYVTTGATTKTIRYIHGPGIDQPLAMVMVNNSQTYYYHADGLGSIVAITAITQSVMQRYTYDAYGMPKATNPEFENPYLFTGREWDKEIGLYYYRARYYDPMEGRFISKDPIGFAGGDWNLYRYVQGNPLIYIDPTGTDVRLESTATLPLNLHQRIAVDTWVLNSNWKIPMHGDLEYIKTGFYGISFGMAARSLPEQGFFEAMNEDKAFGKAGSGIVYEDNDPATKVHKVLSTTPRRDIIIKNLLESQVNQTGPYNRFSNNCRKFSNKTFNSLE